MPFVYFGRTHNLCGKTLWELVGHLKNFGVGRLVKKNRHKVYSEPCFMKILVAEPQMDEENSKGKLIVDLIFRGHRQGEYDLSNVAYKPDYILIPKHEEHEYWKAYENFNEQTMRVFAPTAEMPPLFKLVAETKGHHATEFPFSFKPNRPFDNPRVRIAKEGETPNIKLHHGLGTPLCHKLYEGVVWERPSHEPS